MSIKVLVVDDSDFMRQVIRDLLVAEDIEVITARSGQEALAKIEETKPDVVTLDVEMPGMNGLEVLKAIMIKNPLPVIMLSGHTQAGNRITMEALALGAVDFVAKPSLTQSIESVKAELCKQIRAVVKITDITASEKELPAGEKPSKQIIDKFPECKLVAIGSSTGGPRALEKVLVTLPKNFPVPVLITQHMPAGFTKAFAHRLHNLCQIKVKEAEEGEQLRKGVAYIAPGGYHMVITHTNQISLNQDPPVEYVRPSVNVMLESAMQVYGNKIIGVILTGMGKDGAEAMVKLKKNGGRTVVQNESTSVVFSMPKAVIEKGAADIIAPIQSISGILQAALI